METVNFREGKPCKDFPGIAYSLCSLTVFQFLLASPDSMSLYLHEFLTFKT
jgi:hypothetical protein